MKTLLFVLLWIAALTPITTGPVVKALQNGQSKPTGIGCGRGIGPGSPNCRQFEGNTIYRVGGEVSAPKLIFPEQVDYQPPTLFANSSDVVCPCTAVLRVVVGRDGLVHYPRIVRDVNPELDRRALAWVKKWRFEPARKNDKPVDVETNLEVRFR
jgi:TonB family protein